MTFLKIKNIFLQVLNLLVKKMVKSHKMVKNYEKGLIERLKESEFAQEYLNTALEDTDEGSEERFLLALKHVTKARGVSETARKSGLARQALYQSLSKKGNPEFLTLKTLLYTLGFRLAIEQLKIKARRSVRRR